MLAGVSRRTTPIFEWLTALPETYINRGTVTCTVTEALSARHAVPAAARIATTRTKTTKIPARRRILTTYATNQHTFDFGSRKRTLVGTIDLCISNATLRSKKGKLRTVDTCSQFRLRGADVAQRIEKMVLELFDIVGPAVGQGAF